MLSAKWRSHFEHGEPHGPQAEALVATLDQLEKRAIDAYVIGESPTFQSPVLQMVMDRRIHGNVSLEANTLDTTTANQALSVHADAHGAAVLDVASAFCVRETCTIGDDSSLYFWDRNHFTPRGSRLAAKHLLAGTSLAIGPP